MLHKYDRFPCVTVLPSAHKMKNRWISQDHEGIHKAMFFSMSDSLSFKRMIPAPNSFALRYANPFHGHLSRYLAEDHIGDWLFHEKRVQGRKKSINHDEYDSSWWMNIAPENTWAMPACQGLNWEDAMEPLREVSALAVMLVILYVPWLQLEQSLKWCSCIKDTRVCS